MKKTNSKSSRPNRQKISPGTNAFNMRISTLRRRLDEIKQYKITMAADGFKPDQDDKELESELILRLRGLEKQLDATGAARPAAEPKKAVRGLKANSRGPARKATGDQERRPFEWSKPRDGKGSRPEPDSRGPSRNANERSERRPFDRPKPMGASSSRRPERDARGRSRSFSAERPGRRPESDARGPSRSFSADRPGRRPESDARGPSRSFSADRPGRRPESDARGPSRNSSEQRERRPFDRPKPAAASGSRRPERDARGPIRNYPAERAARDESRPERNTRGPSRNPAEQRERRPFDRPKPAAASGPRPEAKGRGLAPRNRERGPRRHVDVQHLTSAGDRRPKRAARKPGTVSSVAD